MKRLLDDLDALFDLEYPVQGVRLGELIEPFDMDLDESSLQGWGTAGPAGEIATVSR
jgi:hypothetical protein